MKQLKKYTIGNLKKLLLTMAVILLPLCFFILADKFMPDVFAANEESFSTDDGTFYVINNGEATITATNYREGGTFTVPDYVTKDGINYPVTSIEGGAFANNNNWGIEAIYVNPNNRYFTTVDGVLFNKNKTTLIVYPVAKKGDSYTIPNTVTCLGDDAFAHTKLKNINVPDSVNYISIFAFGSSTLLETVRLPEKNVTFKESIFLLCEGLKNVTLPKDLAYLSAYFFSHCSSLESMELPGTLFRVLEGAFEGCINLKSVIVPSNLTRFDANVFKNANKDLIMYLIKGSPAETYAIENNIKYEYLKLASLNITNPPNKTVYTNGSIFNKNGMEFSATYQYSNKTTSPVPVNASECNLVDKDPLEIGTNKVTISYTVDNVTKTVDQPITVIPRTLSSIVIKQEPNKKVYTEGQRFDNTGMIVEAVFDAGTENENRLNITNYEITNRDNLALGQNAVTISYTENGITKTANQPITVGNRVLGSIVISNPPNKISYTEGQNFDSTGMEVTANYTNGTSRTVTGFTIVDGNNLSIGKNSVTIRYEENGKAYTTTQTITVNRKVLTSIGITNPPNKISYIEGQNFASTGMEVTAYYNNGTSQEVTGYTVTDGNNLTIGKTNVTISYTENTVTQTVTQNITVVNKKLDRIEISKEPNIKAYKEGENFDPTGMEVTAYYDNGKSQKVTGYTVTDGNNLTIGKTNVTISYEENGITKTTTQDITIIKKKLDRIAVTREPNIKTYIEGQNFDSTGMQVTVYYDNGASQVTTGYIVTDRNNLTAGKTNVTISYEENGITKTTTQNITVTKKKLDRIEISKAQNTKTYIEGQDFDPTGMEVTAYYDNGKSQVVTGYTVTDGNKLTQGKTSVTVSYEEDGIVKTVTQKILIVKNALDRISITNDPNTKTYIEGQNFDTSGMEVTAFYTNGSSKVITGYTVTDGQNLTQGKTSVTISYEEDGVAKTTIQNITVEEKQQELKPVVLSGIEIKEQATKKNYKEGEKFDKAGMVVVALYSDGSMKEIQNYSYNPTGELTVNDVKITVSYTEKEITKTVDVTINVVGIPIKPENNTTGNTNNNKINNNSSGSYNNNTGSIIVTNTNKNNTYNKNNSGNVIILKGNSTDATTKNTSIPKTGFEIKMIICIITFMSIALVAYIKYTRCK